MDQARSEPNNLKEVLASLTRKLLSPQLFGLATFCVLFHPLSPFPVRKIPLVPAQSGKSFSGLYVAPLRFARRPGRRSRVHVRHSERGEVGLSDGCRPAHAFGFLMLLDAIGFAPGGTRLVDFASPDYTSLISIAFLSGVSGRATLKTLGNLWQKLVGTGGSERGNRQRSGGQIHRKVSA